MIPIAHPQMQTPRILLEASWLRPITMTHTSMTVERAIRILAGTMILTSLALYLWVSTWGLLLALFVSLNLIQSSFTGLCPAESILRRLGVRGACT